MTRKDASCPCPACHAAPAPPRTSASRFSPCGACWSRSRPRPASSGCRRSSASAPGSAGPRPRPRKNSPLLFFSGMARHSSLLSLTSFPSVAKSFPNDVARRPIPSVPATVSRISWNSSFHRASHWTGSRSPERRGSPVGSTAAESSCCGGNHHHSPAISSIASKYFGERIGGQFSTAS